MNTDSASPTLPLDDRHSLAQLRGGNRPLLAGRSTPNDNQVVLHDGCPSQGLKGVSRSVGEAILTSG